MFKKINYKLFTLLLSCIMVSLFSMHVIHQAKQIKLLKKQVAMQTMAYQSSAQLITDKDQALNVAHVELTQLSNENQVLTEKLKALPPLLEDSQKYQREIATLTAENKHLIGVNRAASGKAEQYEILLEKKLDTCVTENARQQDDLKAMTQRLEHFESME